MTTSRNERVRRLALARHFMLHRPETMRVTCADGTVVTLLIAARWMEDGDVCYGTAPLAFAITGMTAWALFDERGVAFDLPFTVAQPDAYTGMTLVARIHSTYDTGESDDPGTTER